MVIQYQNPLQGEEKNNYTLKCETNAKTIHTFNAAKTVVSSVKVAVKIYNTKLRGIRA